MFSQMWIISENIITSSTKIHKLLRRHLPFLCKLKWSFKKPPLMMSCAGKSWISFVLMWSTLQSPLHLRVSFGCYSCTDDQIGAERLEGIREAHKDPRSSKRLESDQLHPRIFVYLLGRIACASLRWISSGQKYNHKVSKIVKETSYWCLRSGSNLWIT